MTNRIDKIQHSRDMLLSQPLQKKEPTLKLKTLRWCGSTNKDYVQGFGIYSRQINILFMIQLLKLEMIKVSEMLLKAFRYF